MALKLNAKSTAKVIKRLQQVADKWDNTQKRILRRAGNVAVNTARASTGYKDRTANLRSSVGFVVTGNGNVTGDFKAFEGENGAGSKGKKKAREIAYQLAVTHSDKPTLIVVAGMPYASFVEAKGRDVLTSAKQKAFSEIKELLNRLNE